MNLDLLMPEPVLPDHRPTSQQHDDLVNRIKLLLEVMSQNVTTVECMISSIACNQDELEVYEKMSDTTAQLESLIPLMRAYLAAPEPMNPLLRQRWWMDKTRINRELEVILHNFHLLHLVLSASDYSIPSDGTLRSILRAEMKKFENVKPHFLVQDYDDTADIVAQAEKTFLMFLNHYKDSRSGSYVARDNDEYWANNNNDDNNNNNNNITNKIVKQDGEIQSHLKQPEKRSSTQAMAKRKSKHHSTHRRKSSTQRKEPERKHYCAIS